MGDCRKCRDGGPAADPAQRLEELLSSARLEHPDPRALTERILERLADEQPPDEESDADADD